MDWGYIAGYFDGEGTAWCNKRGKSHNALYLGWVNTNRESIDAIHAFVGCGHVRTRRKDRVNAHYKPLHCLVISRRSDVIRVAKELLAHCIIKREAILKVLAVAEGMSDENPNRGKLAAAGPEEIRRRYWDDKSNLQEIGDEFGVTRGAVKNYMVRNNISRRSLQEGLALYRAGT